MSKEEWVAKGPYVFEGKNCIAVCDTDNGTQARYAKNARLMAAAPEMFEALRAAALAIGEWSRPTGANGMTCAPFDHPLRVAQAQVYEAMAKAEGQS